MGQCLTCCWPPVEHDSIVVSDERQPLLSNQSPGRIVDAEPADVYPRDDEQSTLNKIVQDTARNFVDIHSADAPVTNNSRDKESIYQCVQGSTLATMPSSNSTSLPHLPDCAASPTEIFSKTTVTRDDISLIQDGAAQADGTMDFKIKNTENVVETFDGTPKV